MIRRLNYTERVKIRRSDIDVTLYQENGESWFDADLSKVSEYNLPTGSLVFLEAYRPSTWMRFEYGSIGNLTPPDDSRLVLFDSPEGIKFRVKVTASGKIHKLLAEADAIPLRNPNEDEGTQDPLLPVIPSKELGDEIYRLDFSDDYPVLLINSEAGNYKDIGRSSAFLSLVIPALLREILIRIILIDKKVEIDDASDWRSRWLKFIKQLPGLGEMPRVDSPDECADWIQSAMKAFARKQKTKARFKEFWRDEA